MVVLFSPYEKEETAEAHSPVSLHGLLSGSGQILEPILAQAAQWNWCYSAAVHPSTLLANFYVDLSRGSDGNSLGTDVGDSTEDSRLGDSLLGA